MIRFEVCGIVCLLSSLSVGKVFLPESPQKPIAITSEGEPLFDDDFDVFVEATLHKRHVPGLSVAVVDNGKIISKVPFSSFY